jgi:hypothetical protein
MARINRKVKIVQQKIAIINRKVKIVENNTLTKKKGLVRGTS